MNARAVLGNIGPRSWQYGTSTARPVQTRLRANIPQCGPEQAKLVNSLLYGVILFGRDDFWSFHSNQFNFRRDVREFPALNEANSTKLERCGRTCFKTSILCFGTQIFGNTYRKKIMHLVNREKYLITVQHEISGHFI